MKYADADSADAEKVHFAEPIAKDQEWSDRFENHRKVFFVPDKP